MHMPSTALLSSVREMLGVLAAAARKCGTLFRACSTVLRYAFVFWRGSACRLNHHHSNHPDIEGHRGDTLCWPPPLMVARSFPVSSARPWDRQHVSMPQPPPKPGQQQPQQQWQWRSSGSLVGGLSVAGLHTTTHQRRSSWHHLPAAVDDGE